MRYAVKTYIGRDYFPGEIIEAEELSDENKIKWLLEAGAIEEIAPEEPGAARIMEPAEASEMDDPETEDIQEEYVEVEAPEIDAMAGIVKEDKKPSRRRKGGK